MLTILGSPNRFCDGLTRRNFLKIGGLALGGLSMPEILRAEGGVDPQGNAVHGNGVHGSASRGRHKSVIMVFLPGGPPHQDMFDLKMDAPSEVRGEFRPIDTNVPGIQICEHFPRIAKRMDRFAVIRSIVGANGDHYSFQCFTGRMKNRMPPGGWPSMGSVLSKLEGQVHPGMPAFVGLAPKMGHMPWADPGPAGFLGVAHAPFQPAGEGKDDMFLQGVTLDRLADRKALLASFDRFRRDVDSSGLMEGMDAFTQQAFGVLTSGRLAEALDLSREDPLTRERYGFGFNHNRDDGGPRTLDQFLVARRLVEAGVRCVTLAFSRWDWHNANFRQGREDMPLLDQAVSALVDDLHQRGLDKDVSVIVWGEFGRTPQINKDAGRDHWPNVSCALLACGGMKTGQVIGATDRLGAEATDRPVTFPEVHATLYHNLGIDLSRVTVKDLAGRPQYLVDAGVQPIRELIG